MRSYSVMTAEQARLLADRLVDMPLPFTVVVKEGMIRSTPQNDLLWKWNEEIARQRGDMTAQEVHRENKLLVGCPILMRDPAFKDFVSRLSGLTYEQKLEAMDFVGVTSRMTKKEMSEYLDTIHSKFASRGLTLTDPQSLKYENDVME